MSNGQEQGEGNQAAPFLVPALILHQPLPGSRLMSLSGHCMAAAGNTAHETILRMAPSQGPACTSQLLFTNERLGTEKQVSTTTVMCRQVVSPAQGQSKAPRWWCLQLPDPAGAGQKLHR